MGYTTNFKGSFKLNKKLDEETYNFLIKLSETRRMIRNTNLLPKTGFEKYGFKSWGEGGEFFVDAEGYAGQDEDKSIQDYNTPPPTQPGLWCQWIPDESGMSIEWNEAEKFYYYIEWLKYIIDKVLKPRNYILNGTVRWQGEDSNDFGKIKVKNNVIFKKVGQKSYGKWQDI